MACDLLGNKLPPPPPNRDPSTTLTLGRMSTLSSSRPSLFGEFKANFLS